jgi:alpha-ketoglutarate-dependent taurine dioxygenase
MSVSRQCPRCGTGQMRAWNELSDEEREVVRRLPAAADYSLEERQGSRQWCTRCWYEEGSGVRQDA